MEPRWFSSVTTVRESLAPHHPARSGRADGISDRARSGQVDYRLTETGASLTHLVQSLAKWSLAHRDTIAQAGRDYDAKHPGDEIR